MSSRYETYDPRDIIIRKTLGGHGVHLYRDVYFDDEGKLIGKYYWRKFNKYAKQIRNKYGK